MRFFKLPIFAQVALAVGAGFLVTLMVSSSDIVAPAKKLFLSYTERSNCNIKGNISINTGERIYHVPGQEYYWETRISAEYGERWFCSESDARAAGWRKSRI